MPRLHPIQAGDRRMVEARRKALLVLAGVTAVGMAASLVAIIHLLAQLAALP